MQIAALYQEEIGEYDKAVEAYDKAAERGETSLAEIRFRQGECHEKSGKLDEALASYEAADTGDRTDPFRIASLAQIGQILENRGNWQGAIDAYQRIVDAQGKPEWTEMAQGRIDAIRETQVAGG